MMLIILFEVEEGWLGIFIDVKLLNWYWKYDYLFFVVKEVI